VPGNSPGAGARVKRPGAGGAKLGRENKELELTDPATADLAGRWRQEIDAQERKVVEWFAPAKQAAFKAHAAICRQEKDALA
jgi:hypothetical protein